MVVTLSIDDEVMERARNRAESMGTSVDRLIGEYLHEFSEDEDAIKDAAEFERLSRLAHGNSRGWKFNRDELYET